MAHEEPQDDSMDAGLRPPPDKGEGAPSAPAQLGPAMYVSGMAAVLNRWFGRYDEARVCLENEGGYLLPFRNQFFVTTSEAIRELGLDPEDPDWERIGYDWVRPRDPDAWARLSERRRFAEAGGGTDEGGRLPRPPRAH